MKRTTLSVSAHFCALSCLYFVCRLNAPVIVDCRRRPMIFCIFFLQLGRLHRMIMLQVQMHVCCIGAFSCYRTIATYQLAQFKWFTTVIRF